jgi:hypothetical protein
MCTGTIAAAREHQLSERLHQRLAFRAGKTPDQLDVNALVLACRTDSPYTLGKTSG